MFEPDASSPMVVFYDRTTGRLTRSGTMDPALNGREGEDHILVPASTDLTDKMVALASRTLVAVPADHPKTEPEILAAWQSLRQTRDSLLAATDRYMVEDYPVSAEEKARIRAYRTALRALPKTVTDPFDVSWPTID